MNTMSILARLSEAKPERGDQPDKAGEAYARIDEPKLRRVPSPSPDDIAQALFDCLNRNDPKPELNR